MTTPHPTDATAHVTQRALDVRALGGLPPGALAALEQHLATCARCAAAAAEDARLREAFTRRVLPATLPHVRERTAARPLWARLGLGWGGAAALAFAALLAVVALPLLRTGAGDAAGVQAGEPEYGIKGGEAATLLVYVRRGERIWRAAPGEPLQAGDEVRFAVEGRGLRYVLLGSADAGGRASVYHPYGGARSARLAPGPEVQELPGSIVLDAAGPERVFALLSDVPLSAELAADALRRLGAGGAQAIRTRTALGLRGVQAEGTFLIEKVQP